ncbi:hypothetical protein ABES02_13580 [Neobacillus pocheonensis]|uniref:hypothetical protein n=1 Tax=Neobacillus pocheonensis TaxID=363869 RepID=UPI003D29A9F4
MKSKKEMADTNDLHAELQEIKFELMKLNDFKAEFEQLKGLFEKNKKAEPELVGAVSSK